METSTSLLRDTAWLSQAAYLDFTGLSKASQPEDVSARLQGSTLSQRNRFSLTQANSLVGGGNPRYAFQHHARNDVSGFSATVFKSLSGDQYTIAVRGTELPGEDATSDLLDADFLGVGLNGSARRQLFSAYRYYKRLITPAGQPVQYSRDEQVLLAILQSGRANPILVSGMLQRDRGLNVIDAGATVNFTGHSLGGHVATLLAAMVEQFGQGSVGDVVTYNAPGQRSVFNYAGINVSPIRERITNVVAEDGMSLAAGLYGPVGRRLNVDIEGSHGLFDGLFENHSILRLSDALALHELFAVISGPGASLENEFAKVSAITRASHKEEDKTLGATLDSLRRLFLGTGGSQPTRPGDRESYYANLAQLRDERRASGQVVRIEPLNGRSAEDLRGAALANTADGAAYRYALLELNAFVALGADYASSGRAERLSLYDSATGTGTLTDRYVEDRARMLRYLLEGNVADRGVASDPQVSNQLVFADQATRSDITVLGSGPATIVRHVKFADPTAPRPLEGGAFEDRLYGAAGADQLFGKAGEDYLEGGAGADQLEGGAGDDVLSGDARGNWYYGSAGNDTVLFGRGSGADVADGFGQVDGQPLGLDKILVAPGVTLADLAARRDPNGHLTS